MQKNNGPWLSVPQFGDWEMKGEIPDYSLNFSKIRETRKQNKRDVFRASMGNEEEIIVPDAAKSNRATVHNEHRDDYHQSHDHGRSPTSRRSFFGYFNCCVRAWCVGGSWGPLESLSLLTAMVKSFQSMIFLFLNWNGGLLLVLPVKEEHPNCSLGR